MSGIIGPSGGGGTQTVTGTVTANQGGAPWRVNTQDGDQATLGVTTDAAVGDATGTVNAHVRQIAKLLAAALTVGGTIDVTDRTGRLLGHVTVDSVPTTTVNGTVTANAGTNLNTSALALETGGNLATVATNTAGLAKDATVAKDASLTTLDTDLKATQPRDVTDRTGRLLGHVNVDNFPATQAVSGAVTPTSSESAPVVVDAREFRQLLAEILQVLKQQHPDVPGEFAVTQGSQGAVPWPVTVSNPTPATTIPVPLPVTLPSGPLTMQRVTAEGPDLSLGLLLTELSTMVIILNDIRMILGNSSPGSRLEDLQIRT